MLETISTSVVIGADGVKSRIASYAGLEKPARVLPGIQIEAPYASEDSDFVELFPGSSAPGFFAWTVPIDEKISRIGLALEPGLAYKNDRKRVLPSITLKNFFVPTLT